MDWTILKGFLSGLPVGGLIVYFSHGWIDDYFRKNTEVRTDKRKLAKEILSTIAEAESSNYQKTARNREQIKNLAIQAGPYNSKIDDLVRRYEFTWWLASEIFSRIPELQENLFFYRELEERARDQSLQVKNIVNKWLK